jgi:hypothetical protein
VGANLGQVAGSVAWVDRGDAFAASAAVARATVQGFFSSEPPTVWLLVIGPAALRRQRSDALFDFKRSR